jgi:hypothetical protein
MQGLNVDLWSEKGLNLCVVGDVSADELEDFRKKSKGRPGPPKSRAE